MKKVASAIGVICVLVLAGMALFSSPAQADSGRTETVVRQGHVEILDVQPAHPLCASVGLYLNLIGGVEAQGRELAVRLGTEARAEAQVFARVQLLSASERFFVAKAR